jgi:Barrel-sandwich domain of CusB or HlyD membrane-fusion
MPPSVDYSKSQLGLSSLNCQLSSSLTSASKQACSPDVAEKLELVRRIGNQLLTNVDVQAVYYREAFCQTQDSLAHRVLPETESPGLPSLGRVLDAACRAAQRSGKPDVQRQTAPQRTLLAIPIEFAEGQRSAVGISIANNLSKSELDWLTAAWLAAFCSEASASRQEILEREVHETTAVIELIEDAIEADNVRTVCQRLLAKLQTFAPTSRIAIGYRHGSRKTCRLIAISGHAKYDRYSPLSASIESLMLELIEKNNPISWSLANGNASISNAAQVAANLGSECQSISGIPISSRDGEIAAAFVLLDNETDSQGSRTIAFLQAAAPSIACVLNAAQRCEQNYATRVLRNLGDSWLGRRKLIIAGLLSVLTIGLCIPMPYQIACPSLIEPIHRRYVAAPFDGTLDRAFVKPGDVVRTGELIARMDDREIRWKRASVLADQNQAQKKRDTAQAGHSYAEQQIAQLEIDRLQFELQMLDDRAANLEVLSPIDGVVTSGDLARVEGAPLSVGQTLFEIAPTDRMIAEVSIADYEIAYVNAGQVVDIRFDAYPGKTWKANILKIRPRAEVRDNLNVFVAEVELTNEDERLRPGMKGRAKINSDRRAYGWILFHQPFEYVAKKLAW